MEILEEDEEVAKTTGQIREEENLRIEEFTALEVELKEKIILETNPVAKANMEWDLCLIYNANMELLQYGHI